MVGLMAPAAYAAEDCLVGEALCPMKAVCHIVEICQVQEVGVGWLVRRGMGKGVFQRSNQKRVNI